MSMRGSAGLHASVFLPRPHYPISIQQIHPLRHFSVFPSKRNSPKIRTRFSGPPPDSAPAPVASQSLYHPAKKIRLADSQNSSASDGEAISVAETQPFPDQDLSSTLPAGLERPAAPKRQDHGGALPITIRLSYLYRLGKSYLTFYKTGLKNVWFNYKEYRKIKQRLGPYSLTDAVKYSGKDGRPTISRKEFQLCLRARHDIKKLIPFGLILLICGEFTPFVVLALGSGVVPSTCRIPSQIDKDYRKLSRRLKKVSEVSLDDENSSGRSLATLEARVGYAWGLMPSPQPLPLIHHLLRSRVKRRAEELVCDAILVRREGGVARLDARELLLFAQQASLVRFQRLLDGAFHSPLHIAAGQTRQRCDSSYEEYIDITLRKLRELEHDPSKHYVAGLNY